MTAWTVQCGYAAYYANTVTVEAETLDEALDAAIAAANADPNWTSLDHCGPTFVDAVAAGANADPWQDHRSAIPVPEQFAEEGVPPAITVTVKDGRVRIVAIENGPARLIVRDGDPDIADPAPFRTGGTDAADPNNELPPRGG